ncbi:TonB-dependent receptor domain-containing protein [Sansalvadorimonas verongulae]|uniref:TonB-dependent receptor domain-containing protein n=1 Tax=Sansalvadorimonas verongulae TaxID=2172824 RepID=UPI0018AD1387|nr:TonB-dependent receptor [Sansalvadorimonas verongulae]
MSQPTFARTNNTVDDIYQLDDVIVTASRTAQTVDQALAPVSVITRKDIEQSQATSVPELLSNVPGVQISTYGGSGAEARFYLRGSLPSQTLVLVDGQRIGSAAWGQASIPYLDPNQIERIEVVRGPRASLYGADTIGGVVNIITRTGKGAPSVSVMVGYGSRNSRNLGANISGKEAGTSFSLGAHRSTTDGFTRQGKKNEDDDDFYNNTSGSVKLEHQVSDNVSTGFALTQNKGVTEIDPGKARTHFNNKTATGFIKANVTDNWLSTLSIGYNVDDSETVRSPYPSFFKTAKRVANWQNDISITDNTLITAGLDYYNDHLDSSTKFTKNSRDNKALFVQSQTGFSNSDLQLSARRDDNEAYGKKTTGNIAYGYNLPSDIRLIASYGTAFRAPTFSDLYAPPVDYGNIYLSNPNLKPETSKNKELELRGKSTFANWSISAFQNDIDNLIVNTKHSSNSLIRSNVDQSRIRGVEVSLKTKIEEWTLATNITVLDPKNRDTGKVLEHRAKQIISILADRSFGDISVGGTFTARSHSYDDAGNTQRVAGYGTVDLRTSWQATQEIKLGARLENLFNKKYETLKGYNEAPRGIFATLTWSPKI